VTEVSLTPKGDEMLSRMRKATENIFLKGYAGLTPPKIERLNKMLMQVFDNLSHY
jgi:DNA-binding MarR family transcriptional regulator